MGTQIAIFHVLSAIIVVSVVHFILKSTTGDMPSNKVVKMVSYSAIAVIGGFMLWRAIQTARLKHDHSHDHHDHGDDHRHQGDVAAHELEGEDEHDAEHHHAHAGCVACEAVAKRKKGISGWLALAVGAVPCTGALLVLLFGMANDLLLPAIYMVIAI